MRLSCLHRRAGTTCFLSVKRCARWHVALPRSLSRAMCDEYIILQIYILFNARLSAVLFTQQVSHLRYRRRFSRRERCRCNALIAVISPPITPPNMHVIALMALFQNASIHLSNAPFPVHMPENPLPPSTLTYPSSPHARFTHVHGRGHAVCESRDDRRMLVCVWGDISEHAVCVVISYGSEYMCFLFCRCYYCTARAACTCVISAADGVHLLSHLQV